MTNIDTFEENIREIADSLSATVQVGKIPSMVATVSTAAKEKGYDLPSIIKNGAEANIDVKRGANNHKQAWLVKTFGEDQAQQIMQLARLSIQLETFISQQAVAIITPSDFNNRRPAHQTEKDLTTTLVTIGGVGQKQAEEVIRRCKKLIEGALLKTVHAQSR